MNKKPAIPAKAGIRFRQCGPSEICGFLLSKKWQKKLKHRVDKSFSVFLSGVLK
ncbi:Uncharacterized protein dnm_034280 [Desulfonema magnum]|uniref:Uncharacterized protein n=1 Tax=Desulfonema magnum TaxID=45655 RepID=A0A975BL21_9BACT|nr:Uncharacterized protein dnm_034280 [Desulfonema magnum]